MQGFKSRSSAQRFLATHAAIYNNFTIQPHLNTRRYMRELRTRAASDWTIATVAV